MAASFRPLIIEMECGGNTSCWSRNFRRADAILFFIYLFSLLRRLRMILTTDLRQKKELRRGNSRPQHRRQPHLRVVPTERGFCEGHLFFGGNPARCLTLAAVTYCWSGGDSVERMRITNN